MASALPFVGAAGTAINASGQIMEGQAQNRSAKIEARSLDQAANNKLASSQRESLELERQGKLEASRVLAVAAASGGGASDPTVMNLMSRLAGENNYRQMTALYEGEEEARQLRNQASVTRNAGKRAEASSKLGAFGTVLSGGSSLYSKYGTR